MGLAGFTTAPGANGCGEGSVLMQVRLDGKTIRGAKDAGGNQRHLLAALVGPDAATSVVAAQTEVGPKTDEVPMAPAVLGQIDPHGKIVTADALHTVKATAQHIHERGGGGPVRAPGERESPRPVRRPHVEGRPDRAPQPRQSSRPAHHPDHSSTARPAGRSQVRAPHRIFEPYRSTGNRT
jgi:hypothetical protein